MRKPGELQNGQLIERDVRAVVPYTQQIVQIAMGGVVEGLGDPNTELTPVDANSVEKKVFDYTAADAAKLAKFHYNLGFTSFQLPRVLVSLTPVFSTSKGTGAGSSTPAAGSAGSSWGISVSAGNNATSSLDYVPDLQPVFESYDASNVPCIECYFFTQGNTTLAGILTRLTAALSATVLVWPKFRPKEHTFTLKGQATNLSTTANLQLSASSSSGSTSLATNEGWDYSIQTRTVIKSIDLPPSIHGAISISPHTQSDTIGVSASASVTGTGDLSGTATSGTSVPVQTVTATITPTSIGATSPTTVPTSGLYLKEIQPQFSEGDLFLQRAIVVDFAYFA